MCFFKNDYYKRICMQIYAIMVAPNHRGDYNSFNMNLTPLTSVKINFCGIKDDEKTSFWSVAVMYITCPQGGNVSNAFSQMSRFIRTRNHTKRNDKESVIMQCAD